MLRLNLLAACCLLLAIPPAQAATQTTGTIAQGTRFATTYYVCDSGQPGPTVIVTGGIHGDEPAGAAAADQIRRWTVVRGRIIVIPKMNVTGLDAGKRRMTDVDTSLADLNRDFPRVGQKEPAIGTPAIEIWAFVEKQKPDWLIDLHEAGALRGSRTGAIGNSLLPCPSADMSKALPVLLDAVNATISDPGKRFVAARPPKDSTLARAAGAHLGIRAMIIETTKTGQTMTVRVDQHRALVRALLVHLGMLEAAADPPKR